MRFSASQFPVAAASATFEMVGIDFLVDENFKPWLLEVNAVPSMARKVINALIPLPNFFEWIFNEFQTRLSERKDCDTLPSEPHAAFEQLSFGKPFKKQTANCFKTWSLSAGTLESGDLLLGDSLL